MKPFHLPTVFFFSSNLSYETCKLNFKDVLEGQIYLKPYVYILLSEVLLHSVSYGISHNKPNNVFPIL